MSDKNKPEILVTTLELEDVNYTPYREAELLSEIPSKPAELEYVVSFRGIHTGSFEKYVNDEGDIDRMKVVRGIVSGDLPIKF